MTPEEFIDLAESACIRAEENGWLIRPGEYSSKPGEGQGCCPLTAVGMLHFGYSRDSELFEEPRDLRQWIGVNLCLLTQTLKEKYNIVGDMDEAFFFTLGFDGVGRAAAEADPYRQDWFRAGKELRTRYDRGLRSSQAVHLR